MTLNLLLGTSIGNLSLETAFHKTTLNLSRKVGVGTVFKHGTRTYKRSRSNSVNAVDTWHAAARWIKYLETLEGDGKRWSKPHVTTLCPFYIKLLADNFEIVEKSEISEYEHFSGKHNPNHIYQPIYLSDKRESTDPHSIRIKVCPDNFKWVVINGTAHDRYEVGRCIGGIFSCEEYRGTIGMLTETSITDAIEEFLHHSTLVPFNSWDPRFRMQPMITDDVPNWLDPEMRKTSKKSKQKVEGGILSDIRYKLQFYGSDWTDALNVQCLSTVKGVKR